MLPCEQGLIGRLAGCEAVETPARLYFVRR